MNETVKWNEMTNEQRDALIHEKVMGLPIVCPGKLIASRVDVPSRAGGTAYTYWELACDTCETVGSAESEDAIPGEHPSEFPIMDYSTDLNDAWQIMDHLKPGRRGNVPFQQGEFMQVATFIDQLTNMDGWWSWTSERLCEAICKAALRSVGVEIE